MPAVVFPLRSNGFAPAQPHAAVALQVAPWRIWLLRIRTRRELAMLHPEQLREVGLDPEAVRAEVSRPFWRA